MWCLSDLAVKLMIVSSGAFSHHNILVAVLLGDYFGHPSKIQINKKLKGVSYTLSWNYLVQSVLQKAVLLYMIPLDSSYYT